MTRGSTSDVLDRQQACGSPRMLGLHPSPVQLLITVQSPGIRSKGEESLRKGKLAPEHPQRLGDGVVGRVL